MPVRAIETKGTIDEQHHLTIEGELPIDGPSKVRVIILVEEETGEMPETDWESAVSNNPAFDFIKDEEDLYSVEDGKEFRDAV